MVKNPEHVKWILQNNDAEEPVRTVREEMIRLIEIFDSKPFTKTCFGRYCAGKTATRCTAYKSYYNSLYWWCDKCNPYQSGANVGTLHAISTYEDALGYVNFVCQDKKLDYEAFIAQLAQEKGLPDRAGIDDIYSFFMEMVC